MPLMSGVDTLRATNLNAGVAMTITAGLAGTILRSRWPEIVIPLIPRAALLVATEVGLHIVTAAGVAEDPRPTGAERFERFMTCLPRSDSAAAPAAAQPLDAPERSSTRRGSSRPGVISPIRTSSAVGDRPSDPHLFCPDGGTIMTGNCAIIGPCALGIEALTRPSPQRVVSPPMRIMLLCSAFNGLTQRVWIELRAAGHEVVVQLSG